MASAVFLRNIQDCVGEALVSRGPVPVYISEIVSEISSVALLDDTRAGCRIGVWESTPGEWPRQQAAAEFSVIVSGRGRFVQDGFDTIEMAPGDMVYIPENTPGTWQITENLRKMYVLLTSQDRTDKRTRLARGD